MAGLNNNVIVNIYTSSPPISAANFGVPLFVAAPGTLGAGFTERVRFYEDIAAADADLTSTDLSQAAYDALEFGFSQSPRASRLAVGRVDEGTAGVYTVTVAGTIADAEEFTVNVDGFEVSYTASVGTDDADAVATALRAALVALQPGSLGHVTFGAVASGAFTITANTGSVPVSVAVSTDSAAGTIAVVTTTPPGDVTTELSALLDESGDWYILTTENKNAGWVAAVAGWIETRERIFIAQTDAADILTSSTTDIASVLQDATRARTAVLYHDDNSEEVAFSWAVKTLEADPDQRTTTFAYKTLSGCTAAPLDATAKTNLEAKNANMFWTFYSFATTWEGKTAKGEYLDAQLTYDWVKARTQEAVAQMYVTVSNQNKKIPITNAGVQQHVGVIKGVLKQGELAEHFAPESTSVTAPLAENITASDRAARLLRISFQAQLAGAFHKSITSGYVLVNLP